jgi:energy-converting hydrogenase Eha subunit A
MGKNVLGVGIDALVVHVSVFGSYASVVFRDPLLPDPPIAYIFPPTTATPKPHLAVGIAALVVQVFWMFVFGVVWAFTVENTVTVLNVISMRSARALVLFTR